MKKLTCFTAATICIVLSSGSATAEKISKKAAKRLAAVAASEAKIPAGYTRLTGDKLLDFIADSTLSGLSENTAGWSYHVYRAPNGRQHGTATNGGDNGKDSGKWTVEGDTYCNKWRNWRKGKKRKSVITYTPEQLKTITGSQLKEFCGQASISKLSE